MEFILLSITQSVLRHTLECYLRICLLVTFCLGCNSSHLPSPWYGNTAILKCRHESGSYTNVNNKEEKEKAKYHVLHSALVSCNKTRHAVQKPFGGTLPPPVLSTENGGFQSRNLTRLCKKAPNRGVSFRFNAPNSENTHNSVIIKLNNSS